jgi:hypothetical protein
MEDPENGDHTCALSCERFFNLIRDNAIHEEELINHRLSWMIQSQSAFFLAFGIVGSHTATYHIHHLIQVLVIIAPVSCAVLYFAILAAIRVFYRHLYSYEHYFVKKSTGEHPLPPVRQQDVFLGILAPVTLPPLFIMAWIVIAINVQF